MFVFRKIWRILFSWNTRFEIHPLALLPTSCAMEFEVRTMPRYSWARWQSVGQKFVVKRGSTKTEVVLETGGYRSNTKTWKQCNLHHQNNLTTRKRSDITQKHVSAYQPYIARSSKISEIYQTQVMHQKVMKRN